MATIFMRILNKACALETLLYVFKEQMNLGQRHLVLTLKHRDGFSEYIKGNIDTVFNSELAGEIEFGDLVLLEHTNIKGFQEFVHLSGNIESLSTLSNAASNISSCAYFLMPKGNTTIFFVIKECPMAKYVVLNNEIISENLFGKKANILNNICGKIDYQKGIYNTLAIL